MVKRISTLLFLLVSAFSLGVHASTLSSYSWGVQKTWYPVLSIGAGTATTSNAGKSKYFPIQNPSTDEFYDYSVNHTTQTSGYGDIFLGVEWNIKPDFAMQAGLDYNQAAPFLVKGTFLQGVDPGSADTYTFQYGMLTRQLLIEGKLLYTLKQYFHPYLLGGVGAAFNKAYHYSTNVPPYLTYTRVYANNSNTTFTYTVGVGVDADIGSNLRLGIGYRLADLQTIQLGNATLATTSVYGTLSQSHLYVSEFLTQVTWIFSPPITDPR